MKIYWKSTHPQAIQDVDESGLLVDYCDDFISCFDSHSDGTHSLQRIHWWASDPNFQICSDEETNSSASWMAHFQQIFIFGWTIPVNSTNKTSSDIIQNLSFLHFFYH